MKDKIDKLHKKILDISKSEIFGDKEIRYMEFKYNNDNGLCTRHRLDKSLGTLTSGSYTKHDMKNINDKITEAYAQVNDYYCGELYIGNSILGYEIFVSYSETWEDVYSRMTKVYDDLVEKKDRLVKEEFDTYNRLKKKYN